MSHKSSLNRAEKPTPRILSLLSRAAQKLEKGEGLARVPDEVLADEAALGPEAKEMGQLCRTFNRMAEAIGERENKQKMFVATAAHDLRNPLCVLAGAAHALRQHDCSPEDRDFYLDCILRNTTSLQTLVEDFNDGVREQAGRLELRREEVNLATLAREVVQDYASIVQSHPLLFDGDGGWILGDGERLKRLVFNLLSNAVKYSKAGREVKVEVWRRDANLCLFVHDGGTGVAPAETERVFLPYTRLDRTSHLAKGDGLGLTSVKRIADAHGAEIHVQGTPGRGSTFEVCFKALERPIPMTRDAVARATRTNDSLSEQVA